MNMEPWKIIQLLERDNSRLYKEDTLDDFFNTEGLVKGLNYCLNNMITFGVADIPNFYIDCCLYGNWLSTLAHEMVHVKQFARDELSANLRRWKTRDHTNTEYWDQPWEKEARRLQSRLVAKFEEELSSQ